MTRQLVRSGILALLLIAPPIAAQCSITATGSTNTSGLHLAFDVVNLTSNLVRVNRIDCTLSGAGDVQIWMVTCGGTMVGKTNQPAAWTQVANFIGITGAGSAAPTVLPPLPNPIDLLPGVTGFYVFRTAGSQNYDSGATTLGSPMINDGTLELQAGYGFGANFPATLPTTVRRWRGTFHYDCVSPGPPPAPGFQLNQTGATLLVNNAVGGTCAPTRVTQNVYNCTPLVPATGTIAMTSNLTGALFDVAFSPLPLVPAGAGGVTLVDGQVINIDLSGPILFLNGFLGAAWPGGTINAPYSVTTQTDASIQGFVLDPAAASGVRFSQATELHVNALSVPASFTPVVADNATVALNVTAPPYCWFPGGIPFYGTTYTTVHLLSNGRIMFGAAGTTTAAPTTALFASNNPSVGVWTDWNPALPGGAIVASPLGSVLDVTFSVPFAGETAGPLANFSVQIDTATSTVAINGLSSIPANPQGTAGGVFSATADSMLLGLSRGGGVATVGSATVFAAGAGGIAANATDMWFDFYSAVNPGPGRCASLVPGTLNSIVFTPSAAFPPNYDWAGF